MENEREGDGLEWGWWKRGRVEIRWREVDSKGVWNLEGGCWIRGRVEDERECGGIERFRVVDEGGCILRGRRKSGKVVWRKGGLVEGRVGCGRKVIFDVREVGSEGRGMRKNEGR